MEEEKISADVHAMEVYHNIVKISLETYILKIASAHNDKEQKVKKLKQENWILTAQGTERLQMIENWKVINNHSTRLVKA